MQNRAKNLSQICVQIPIGCVCGGGVKPFKVSHILANTQSWAFLRALNTHKQTHMHVMSTTSLAFCFNQQQVRNYCTHTHTYDIITFWKTLATSYSSQCFINPWMRQNVFGSTIESFFTHSISSLVCKGNWIQRNVYTHTVLMLLVEVLLFSVTGNLENVHLPGLGTRNQWEAIFDFKTYFTTYIT